MSSPTGRSARRPLRKFSQSQPALADKQLFEHSGQPISRFLSLDGHLSSSVITHAVQRSTRRFLRDGPPQCACLTLLPVRFASRRHYCPRWWSLTPPFHPRRWREATGNILLCCTFCRVAPPGHSPVPCPMESGLSSEIRHQVSSPRPPDQPECLIILPYLMHRFKLNNRKQFTSSLS
jgi:hypothetical protein